MRSILGRLADLGLPQLFKLLVSSGAQGVLDLDTVAGRTEISLRGEQVSGPIPAGVLVACRARMGTFCFRPCEVEEMERWVSVEEIVAAFENAAPDAAPATKPPTDPLSDLRDALTDIELPHAATTVAVVTADPRPYRAMELDWQARGWLIRTTSEPSWPDGIDPQVLILHLPTSVTLVGQERVWLELAQVAAGRKPRIPVLWVGGLADPWLRHQAIMAGVAFLLPAPVGEVGETARWFREEVTALVDAMVSGRIGGAAGDSEAFRDFFVALHMDASPAEVRASVLRVAGGSFDTGVLLAVHDGGFESLGSYGLTAPIAPRLPRGEAAVEDAVTRCVPVTLETAQVPASLAATIGGVGPDGVTLLPILDGQECVAVFVGARPRRPAPDATGLRDLLARAGSMLGVKAGLGTR